MVTTFSTNMGNIAKYISILCIAALPLFLSSCKDNDKEPMRLKDIVSIYGRPDYEEKQGFLPVEIFRKDDGWYAHYITRAGKPLADTKLNVRYYDNDTTVVYFDEISDGPAGYYTLNFMDYGHLMYTSSQSEYFSFIPEFYNKADFDIDNIDEALQSIMKLHPADDHCTQDIADRIRLLIKLNPATLKHPMQLPEMDDFRLTVQTSADGKFRVYSAKYYYGGNGHGNWPEHIMAQCNMGDGVLFIDDFSRDDYNCESYNFPHVEIDLLGQISDKDKTLYFTETTAYDEYNGAPTHKFLRAYAIENGGLFMQNSVFIIPNKKAPLDEIEVKFIDEDRFSLDNTMFRYIPDSKKLLVPLLKTDTLDNFTQYIVYQWNGNWFDYKGSEPVSNYK